MDEKRQSVSFHEKGLKTLPVSKELQNIYYIKK